VIGAELHLDVEAVLWQEMTAWQEGRDSVAGNGDVTVPLLQCPELVVLPSQQGFVSTAPKAHLQIRTWVAQRHQAMSPLVQPGLHRGRHGSGWQRAAGSKRRPSNGSNVPAKRPRPLGDAGGKGPSRSGRGQVVSGDQHGVANEHGYP